MKFEKANRILAGCLSFSIIILCSLLAACGDQPLFDKLSEDQMKVVVKCTYESNSPRGWISAFPSDDSILYDDDSATYGIGVGTDTDPTKFMIDIAGMKVKGDGDSNYFSPYRKTYSAAIDDTGAALFNGTGVVYPNDDVKTDHKWTRLWVYVRKMLFDGAKDYKLNGVLDRSTEPDIALRNTWEFDDDVEAYFHEEEVNGFNFNLSQVLTYYDYLKENYLDINRIFPLKVRIEDGLILDTDDPETVLEVRLVVKNFIKKYEYQYQDEDNDNYYLRHFYALSDWLRDVVWPETNPTTHTAGRMGGNLIGVARAYVPGKTATIEDTDAIVAGGRYVMAIRSTNNIADYGITDLTRPTEADYDQPKSPRIPLLPDSPASTDVANYIEALLDYYLSYEVYKDNYDTFVADDVDTGDYAAEWDAYNDRINAFRIPGIVTWTDNSTFSLTNVPVGYTYNVYYSAAGLGENVLPSAWTLLGSVTLDESDAGLTVAVPYP